jgi:hypothetical protein
MQSIVVHRVYWKDVLILDSMLRGETPKLGPEDKISECMQTTSGAYEHAEVYIERALSDSFLSQAKQ